MNNCLNTGVSDTASDRVAIITDGETIAGADIAQELAHRGYNVVIRGNRQGLANGIVSAIRSAGESALLYEGDITQDTSALDLVQFTVNSYGRLDTLIVTVEDAPTTHFSSRLIPDVEWTEDIIRSTFLITHYAMPYLQIYQGSLAAVYSEVCPIAMSYAAPHEAAVKAWLHGFVRNLAREQVEHNVRANFICSRFAQEFVSSMGLHPAALDTIMSVEPSDVPGLCSFLASKQASYVTGALYDIRDCLPSVESSIQLEATEPSTIESCAIRSSEAIAPAR